MLSLEKIQISGFKSFSDATEAVFPSGITAIVGPNGCGKSNIGDAINWVLGEQSARMLRGASMQDVIFNGSDGRKPVGMAEVTLHLVGPPHDGAEPRRVSITRRLFRDGESEYLLNGARARLRDIVDLLREQRVGVRTYATIEQGRIDQILNAKPKDRRLIIEEAAGIAGFKHKRRLAELKLEATHANLLRVSDVVAEVRRQINSLKRQAAKARRYARFRDELRRTEALRFATRAREIDADLAAAREVEASARDAEAHSAGALAATEASLVEQRVALEDLDNRARALAESLHQLDIEIDRKEGRIRGCRDRIAASEEAEQRLLTELETTRARRGEVEVDRAERDAQANAETQELEAIEARLGALQSDAEGAEQRVSVQRERVEELRRRLFEGTNRLAEMRNERRAVSEALERARVHAERLASERAAALADLENKGAEAAVLGREAGEHLRSVEELGGSLQRLEEALRTAKSALGTHVDRLALARQQEKSHAARLRTLEDVTTRFAGASDGVRLLLTSAGEAGVGTLGVVADFVEASPEFEEAAESYLQALLPAVVVRDDHDVSRAADLLRAGGAGRTLLLSSVQPIGAMAVGVPSNGRAPLPDALLGDPRVLGRLKDRIRLKTGDGFVSQRIGDAVLVDSLDSALALHGSHPEADYLAMTGEVVYASGLIAAGGRHTGETGYLAHTRKIHDERTQWEAAARLASELEARAEEARRDEARLEAETSRARAELAVATQRRIELDLRMQRTEDDHTRALRRVEVLAEEIAGIEADERGLQEESRRAEVAVADAEARFVTLERDLHAEASILDTALLAQRRLGEELAALRADVGARRQRCTATQRERERLEAVLAELDQRIEAVGAQLDTARKRAAEDGSTAEAVERDLAVDVERRQTTLHDKSALEQEARDGRVALHDRDEHARALRADLDARRDASRVAEMARLRVASDRAHLDDLCMQELGVVASDAARLAGEAMAEDPAPSPDELDARIEALKEKIEAIGPVNLMAIDEFAELEQRHAFLGSQKKDLEDSIESLKESIRKINRTTRDRFVDVFEAVRTSYQEVFKVLFNGGRADLVLEEDEDVLEAGIEMVAQPPGKRLGSVSLLSGGEKAMSAIALLFAIFRIQPSPFCLLDEVDAALDDVNVGRFTRMLAEYARSTQFILITHNKRSMESADLLYGVTMEEPGVSRLVSLRL